MKQRAIVAMLVTAAEGTRTRAWLQDKLWSRSGHEHGRASLRRALTDLRGLLGDNFNVLFDVNNTEIRINQDQILLTGGPGDGEFLEGIDIDEEGFEDWVREERQKQHTTSTGINAAARAEPKPMEKIKLHPVDSLQPTLAILPFTTARGYDGTGQLGDMISEELSRTLSRSHMFDVISHLSCRNLDARTVGLQDIRAALNADYIVCGNYRTDSDAILLNADIVEARTGKINCTRDLRGSQRAFLQGDEEVIYSLATEIGNEVMHHSVELAKTRPIPHVETHTLLMSGITQMHRQSVASFARAKTCIEEVISRVPKSSIVHAWMGKWYILSVVQGWSRNLDLDSRIASDFTRKALDLNPECSFSMSIDGFVNNNLLKRFDVAMDRYADAIEIDPNNALAWLLKGTLHAFTDQGEKAVAHTTRARALSPLDPHRYFFDALSAAAALSNNDNEQALEMANRSLRANRRHTSTMRARTVALHRLGRMEEARQSADELLRAEPTLTVSSYLSQHPAAFFESGRSWAIALKEAGIPA
ncbi:tetratricopeptide repeat protein [Actibacterium sp. 188UL27-1]|uniref:tetratricopeptide repeat protein n=1 Tax=Actibacterium sp. 188UL27-1 TaxID=2786961 RepID=UPI00195EFC63|nr:tetratricopeptide repeat protein [Actibacterium sp. 188UL27-1]MBM7068426.1 hypothetical protein [Actibacterium sp. 188UL27-1]